MRPYLNRKKSHEKRSQSRKREKPTMRPTKNPPRFLKLPVQTLPLRQTLAFAGAHEMRVKQSTTRQSNSAKIPFECHILPAWKQLKMKDHKAVKAAWESIIREWSGLYIFEVGWNFIVKHTVRYLMCKSELGGKPERGAAVILFMRLSIPWTL